MPHGRSRRGLGEARKMSKKTLAVEGKRGRCPPCIKEKRGQLASFLKLNFQMRVTGVVNEHRGLS